MNLRAHQGVFTIIRTPTPEVCLSEEAAFLNRIQQSPIDDTARLVYADWLEEQGDPESRSKADFIRLEIRMAASREHSLNRVRWLNKLQKLAVSFDSRWLAIVSHPKLEACRLEFEFKCPKEWSLLSPGEKPSTRFCESCKRNVYYCKTLGEARTHVARGDCVAVSLALIRRPGDIDPPSALLRSILVGAIPLEPERIERIGLARGRFTPPSKPKAKDDEESTKEKARQRWGSRKKKRLKDSED